MLDSWLPFLMYGVLALVIPASMILMSFVFATRPARRTRTRRLPFESGVSQGPPKPHRFTVSFYLTAMLFIVFDIEIVFLYPLGRRAQEARLVRLRRARVLHRDPRARLRLHLAEGRARMAVRKNSGSPTTASTPSACSGGEGPGRLRGGAGRARGQADADDRREGGALGAGQLDLAGHVRPRVLRDRDDVDRLVALRHRALRRRGRSAPRRARPTC